MISAAINRDLNMQSQGVLSPESKNSLRITHDGSNMLLGKSTATETGDGIPNIKSSGGLHQNKSVRKFSDQYQKMEADSELNDEALQSEQMDQVAELMQNSPS